VRNIFTKHSLIFNFSAAQLIWSIWFCNIKLVGGLDHFGFFDWEFHLPNWRTPSFFRGVGLNHQPERLPENPIPRVRCQWEIHEKKVVFKMWKSWKIMEHHLKSSLNIINILLIFRYMWVPEGKWNSGPLKT
jgi:hypothetical protein